VESVSAGIYATVGPRDVLVKESGDPPKSPRAVVDKLRAQAHVLAGVIPCTLRLTNHHAKAFSVGSPGPVALWLCGQISALAQIPYFNAGPDSGFAQIDFAQMYLDQVNRHAKESEHQKAQDKELIDSGVVSALDLEAPNKAVEQFNQATSLMKAQHSKEAIKHLQRAIDVYPKFVSAHIGLGLAYLDQEDTPHARSGI